MNFCTSKLFAIAAKFNFLDNAKNAYHYSTSIYVVSFSDSNYVHGSESWGMVEKHCFFAQKCTIKIP